MGLFGKQYYFCPNCGDCFYDTKVTSQYVSPLLCSDECRKEWEIKYARSILGKDGLKDEA